VETIQAMLLGTHEYYGKAGGTNDLFLDAMFQDTLHRPINPGERNAFHQLFANHGTTTDAARTLLGTFTYTRNMVNGYFNRFLGHDAAQPGLDRYVTRIRNQHIPD